MPALPLPALAVLVIGGAALLSVAGLLLVHRYIWRPDLDANEVPGSLYAVIGVIYGALLTFIVLVVWERFATGFLLTIGFSYFFRLENLWLQAVMTAVLAAVLAGVLLLIVSLNEPFTGPVQVERAPFEHALDHFNALNLSTPVAGH